MKNERTVAQGLPAWLDGRTSAIIGTVFTVGLGLGTMNLASSSAMRAHVDTRIGDVNSRIGELDTGINRRIDGLSARVDGLDRRLRAVEVGIAEIRGRLGMPDTVRPEGRKTGPLPDAEQGAMPEAPA